MDAGITAKLDDLIARLKAADWRARDAVKDELMAYAKGQPETAHSGIREALETAKKELPLEVKWEVDEVIQAITPPPPPPAAPKKEEPEKKKGLSAADLNMVYDDPRGFMLYKTKKLPERWFATQVDPRTQQPQTFELQAAEVTQLKAQLKGSPYWVLGSGEGQ